MSGITTDLREPKPQACGAQFRIGDPFSLCLLAAHADGSHESVVNGERVRWRTPMTPRREPRQPLPFDQLLDQLMETDGSAWELERGSAHAGPILHLAGRRFREVI